MRGEAAVRTTLDLPGPLVGEAMKLSHHRTKTAVISSALEDFVRKGKIQGLREFRGKLDLDIDLDALRDHGE
jgi:hypothetical protein